LKSDGKDPFTNIPTSLTELKPVPELKERIEKWKDQKRKGILTDEEMKKSEAKSPVASILSKQKSQEKTDANYKSGFLLSPDQENTEEKFSSLKIDYDNEKPEEKKK